ncbi:hemagglutinin [Mycoplasmopsis synoviae]|uniref:Hemagglutinin n=1 Tax=Mycoplasmopsis synoviae TaxID=2109 RepID=A0AAX3F103_MYCSY|nr:hemagglutinin [Mycoplasmopsis synoviae]QGL45102.1 hemagglutinin [Mycoplasmopsis synoviae]QXV99669.1 hemagglutinin [Mycoplasmopsis synoviae]UBM43853.1 hemagglutinin [Mycoplasmopsis synoviae]ULL02627.1 hemagglutinin [Mycoplasmopsis synoviae]UZW64691.1 hemagglutinin [Mycoplasmopsis synoviae]
MPKIVVEDYVSDGDGNNRAQHEAANQQKLQEWFNTSSNWEKLSEQLTKKLGADKFKNVTLTNPQVSYEEVTVNSNAWKNPKVTFNIQAKPGYQLTEPTTEESQISLSIRVLYSSQESNQNLLTIQGASPTAAPNNTTMVSDPNVLRTVNVYLNYTGPNIELDAELPQVGNQNNTSINGTSNVEGTFNDKFKKLLVNVVGESITQTSLLQAIINYVNKFDPKFPASFVLKTNGVAIASVQNNTQLRIGSLNDFLYNNKGFLQQVNTDTKAVYFAVMGVTSNGWVNTFLIRIPLTKFVRPISVLEEQTTEEETQESQEGQENQEQGSTTQTNTESSGTGQSSDLTEVSA